MFHELLTRNTEGFPSKPLSENITIFQTPSLEKPSLQENFNLIKFPTTRFYGSKRKQLAWLQEIFRDIPGRTVLDGFGGTGTVSLLLSAMGKEVTYNDIFKFNEINARALFLFQTNSIDEIELQKYIYKVNPYKGFISSTFRNIFFRDFENNWLDGFMRMISEVQNETVISLLLYCLFQASLQKRPFNLFHRANLYIRDSKQSVSFGNRITWETPFPELMFNAFRELRKAQDLMKYPVQVLNRQPIEAIKIKFDIVYLDPPYFQLTRNPESYLQRYHFLEGLARFNEWPDLIDYSSKTRGFRNKNEAGEWSSKPEFLNRLTDLLSMHKSSTVVMSYVSGSYPSEEILTKMFETTFGTVIKKKMKFNRALSTQGREEILLIGNP